MSPRNKKLKKAVTPSVAPTEQLPTSDVAAQAASDDPYLRDIVQWKEACTTPSLIYDPVTRRIAAHPQYNVSLVQQLARVQGTLLSVLRQAEAQSASMTPKELLFQLERALLYVFTSTCVATAEAPLVTVLSDADAAQHVPTLEHFLAHQHAPAKAITAVAYVVSHGASSTALSGFLDLLERRVADERSPDVQQRRPDAARKALKATDNNLSDVAEQVRAIQIHFHSISTDAQVARQMPTAHPVRLSLEASMMASLSVRNEYYNMLRWLLAVDRDRQAFQVAAAGPLPTADSSAPSLPGSDSVETFVRDYDPFEGKIVLERRDPSHRWGLMLNHHGYLVGVENHLRNASEEGGRLYQSLRQQGEATTPRGDGAVVDGLAILEVNRTRIRPAYLSADELTARQAAILARLRDALSKDALTLHLRVQARPQSVLSAPREVLFDVCPQGSERSIGQRVVLVLQRPSTQVRWGLDVEFGAAAADVVLRDFQRTLQLSEAAQNFLFDHRGQLAVVQVNYKNVADLPGGKQGFATLMSSSLLIALQLEVRAPRDATASPVKPTTSQAAATIGAPEPVAGSTQEAKHHVEEMDTGEAAELAAESDELPDHSAETNLDEDTAEALGHEDVEEDHLEELEESEEKPRELDDVDGASPEMLGRTADDGDAELTKVSEAIADQYLSEEAEDAEATALPAEEDQATAIDGDDAENDILEGQDWARRETLSSKKSHAAVHDDAHRDLLEEYGIDADAPQRDEEHPDNAANSEEDGDPLEEAMNMVSAQLTDAAAPAIATARKQKATAVADVAAEGDEGTLVGEETPSRTRQSKKKASKKTNKKAKKGRKGKQTRTRRTKASANDEEAAEDAEEEADDLNDKEAPGEFEHAAALDPLEGVRDTPLVPNTKDRAEIAIEEAQKSGRRRKAASDMPTVPTDDAPSAEASRVPLTKLMEAAPLSLNHSVRIDRFDGSALEMHRADVSDNWDISVAYNGSDLVLSGINALAQPKLRKHPFAQALHCGADGRVNWTIESINGKDMFGLDKAAKMNVLKTLKNPITTLRLVLKR